MRNLPLTIIVLLLAACSPNKAKEETKTEQKQEVATEEKAAPKTNWKYSEDTNAMDDSQTFYASVKANEVMEFQFPYDGGVTTNLWLRNMSGKTDVLFVISKGQFLPNVMGNKTIAVRFDSKKAEKYSYSMPSDGSTETIFITQTAKFIKELKASEKLTIQCDFFNEGSHTLTFDTKDLEWKQ